MDEIVKTPALGIPIAIVIGSIIISVALYMGRGSQSSPVVQASPISSPAVSPEGQAAAEVAHKVEVVLNSDDPVLGSLEAPVTIVEFSDFQCEFCQTFQQTTAAELIKNYVDTGKVKLVFKNFPLTQIHPQAQLAAQAAACAQAQNQFWPYANLLFDKQSALAEQDLITYAQQLTLPVDQFKTCLHDPKTEAEVFVDSQAGISVGITGTPTLVINGALIDGSQSYEAIAQVIDQVAVTP